MAFCATLRLWQIEMFARAVSRVEEVKKIGKSPKQGLIYWSDVSPSASFGFVVRYGRKLHAPAVTPQVHHRIRARGYTWLGYPLSILNGEQLPGLQWVSRHNSILVALPRIDEDGYVTYEVYAQPSNGRKTCKYMGITRRLCGIEWLPSLIRLLRLEDQYAFDSKSSIILAPA